MPGPRYAFAAMLLGVLACATVAPASAQSYSPGDTFRDCPSCLEMVVVPAGEFLMGSSDSDIHSLVSDEGGESDWYTDEMPRHQVRIGAAIAVGKYEVTFAEWDECVSAGGCGHQPWGLGWGRGNRPVIDVSWDDAQDYVVWLSGKTGQRYRLLTEAEWEYAARAGTRTRYWWGDAIGRGNANCDGCGSRWDNEQTAPVGSFAANPFGLYDVHGNVREWVEDCYHINYSGAPGHAVAWAGGSGCSRVLRGGSWVSYPGYLRSAGRFHLTTGLRVINVGFRVSRTTF